MHCICFNSLQVIASLYSNERLLPFHFSCCFVQCFFRCFALRFERFVQDVSVDEIRSLRIILSKVKRIDLILYVKKHGKDVLSVLKVFCILIWFFNSSESHTSHLSGSNPSTVHSLMLPSFDALANFKKSLARSTSFACFGITVAVPPIPAERSPPSSHAGNGLIAIFPFKSGI